MKSPPCWEIDADAPRHLIQVRYRGRVDAAGLADCTAQIEELLPGWRPGFTVLTDLSELEEMTLDCVPLLTRAMDLFRGRGVATVVRVIPDPSRDIGLNILTLTHYRGSAHVITCASRSEAESSLPPRV